MTNLALVTDDAALGERYGVPIYPSRVALLSDDPPQGYGERVDVDPTDPPLYATGGPAVTVGVNAWGCVAETQKAAEELAAIAARAEVSARRWMQRAVHVH